MAPTTADLIEALRRPGESYEALAARLPISLSTLNRWKKRSPGDWDGLLSMLEQAGWLSGDGTVQAAPQDHLEELAAGVRDLTEGQAELIQEVRELSAAVGASPARGPARPKRKRAG